MKPRRKKTWKICNAKKSRDKHHEGEEARRLYFIQISQTLESSNSREVQKTWNIMKLRGWLESSKLKRARQLPQGEKKLKDQKICIRETSGLKVMVWLKQMVLQHTIMNKHPQTLAILNFRVLQTFCHPCPSDLNPYAWIDLHFRNQLWTFV
jgi:hypothetical protein